MRAGDDTYVLSPAFFMPLLVRNFKMNNHRKVIFFYTFIVAHTISALTPAEALLVERIKDGVSLLVQENPEGWKSEAHKLVNEIEKSYDPSERTHQQVAGKQGTPPPPPGPTIHKGTPPPAPGAAMKKGGPPVPSAPMQKGVVTAPAKPKQIYSKAKLDPLPNEKLLALYEELFTDLPTNWNGQAVEKVEEKTKYGTRVNILYGMPVPTWLNYMGTLKRNIIARGLKTEPEIEKEINDRIAVVRAEKNVKPAALRQAEEKPSEELTEADIVKLIKQLFDAPKTTEMSWMVSIKGNIKALFKLNQRLARDYEKQFMQISGERRFLPLEQVAEVVIPKVEIE